MSAVLLHHRNLLRELVSRDLRARYTGSIMGAFWCILNPLLQLLLYTMVFSVILKIRIGSSPAPASFVEYLFCALLPWWAIQESVTRSAHCFIENSTLIRKIKFPLTVLPSSVVCSGFVQQLLGSVVFLVLLLWNQSLSLGLLPLVLLLFVVQLVMTYGISLVVACLNVFFRDVAQVVGVGFTLLFWLTPIVYPKARAGEAFGILLDLNPLTHMMEGYRWAYLGDPAPSSAGLIYWVAFSIGSCCLGKWVLTRTRNRLVDLV